MKGKHPAFASILSVFFLFILLSGARAQEERFERYKSIKIAYLTEQLNLSPEEAEIFWPVYNDFESRRNKIQNDRRKTAEYFLKNSVTLSDEEILKVLDEYIGYHYAENALLTDYNNKLKEILPVNKVMQLHLAEVQFRRYLIQKLREQRDSRGGRR